MPRITKSSNMKKVIFDTNFWVSYLISSQFRVVDRWLAAGEIVLLFSQESVSEFYDVVRREKFRRYFALEDAHVLMGKVALFANMVQTTSQVDLCRDSKDNFLLALAQDAEADFLITGDADLLAIGTFGKTKILQFADFLAVL